MESYAVNESMTRIINKAEGLGDSVMNLEQGKLNTVYLIKDIKTQDEELKNFLFTLGCYKGETVTVLSILGENYVINVKDARYSIDKDLAQVIII